MKWDFDLNEWEAESAKRDENDFTLIWRIHVCEDGSFSIQDSDCELLVDLMPAQGLGIWDHDQDRKRCFATLAMAKEHCEKIEGEVKPSVIVIEQSNKNEPQPAIEAWFSKMEEGVQ